MEYRLYQKGDEHEIVDLLVDVFSGWPKFDLSVTPLDHWRWKYIDNPNNSLILYSCDDSKVTGCQHILLKKLIVNRNIYTSGIGADIALHKNYRGTGEYRRLNDFKIEQEKSLGLKFRNYIQSHPKLVASDKKIGNLLFPHQAFECLKIKNVDLHFSGKGKMINKYGFLGLTWLNKARQLIKQRKENSDIEIEEIDEFDDSVNAFWNRIKDNYNFIFVRNKEYLNWRYCDKRGGDYTVYIAHDNDELLGYVVLRINRYDERYPCGYIVDLLVDHSTNEAVFSLIEEAVNYFDDNEVNQIKSWNVNNVIYKHLNDTGFVRPPEQLNLMFRKETIVPDDFSALLTSNADEIHFALGDHDHI